MYLNKEYYVINGKTINRKSLHELDNLSPQTCKIVGAYVMSIIVNRSSLLGKFEFVFSWPNSSISMIQTALSKVFMYVCM